MLNDLGAVYCTVRSWSVARAVACVMLVAQRRLGIPSAGILLMSS